MAIRRPVRLTDHFDLVSIYDEAIVWSDDETARDAEQIAYVTNPDRNKLTLSAPATVFRCRPLSEYELSHAMSADGVDMHWSIARMSIQSITTAGLTEPLVRSPMAGTDAITTQCLAALVPWRDVKFIADMIYRVSTLGKLPASP